MKAKTRKNIRKGITGLVAGAMLASGCAYSNGIRVKFLEIETGNKTSFYRKGDERADKTMYEIDTEPYNNSEMTDKAIRSPMWKHYQKAIGAERR